MTTVGSGHLSYCQALEQGFQGCLATTRADLGSGPPVCWVRQTGPAQRNGPSSEVRPHSRTSVCTRRCVRPYFVEPISVEARGGAESAAWKSALGTG